MIKTNNADNKYAPIVLIAYNRAEHIDKTLEALSSNIDAENTRLYCYIDGPKNVNDSKSQIKIKKIVNLFDANFKSLKIIHRKKKLWISK